MAGPVTLVTGASGGIGSALCRVLAGAGHRLVLTALDAEGLAAIADEVVAAGGEAAVLPGDMRDRALPEALVALAVTRFGSLDGLVTGAGASRPVPFVEMEDDALALPDDEKATVLCGNAANVDLLKRAEIGDARLLFVAIPQSFEAGQIVAQARKLNPKIRIVARAHSDDEIAHLQKLGADLTIMGEREIARKMIDQALIGR